MLLRGLFGAPAAVVLIAPRSITRSITGSTAGPAVAALSGARSESVPAPGAVGDKPRLGTQFVPNADFASGVEGWVGYGQLVVAPVGLSRGPGALLTSSHLQPVALTTRPRLVA